MVVVGTGHLLPFRCALARSSPARTRSRIMTLELGKDPHAPQQTASLFDHLVGAGEKRWRDVKSECLRGFDVDSEFEFERL